MKIEERKVRILLVDDDADLLEIMQLLLNKDGYETTTCRNGDDLESLVKLDPPDLILLDLSMQKRNGDEICKVLKSDTDTQSVKVILFSSNHNLVQIASNCGADAILPKPYDQAAAKIIFHRMLPQAV